jgi:hypothetical protein
MLVIARDLLALHFELDGTFYNGDRCSGEGIGERTHIVLVALKAC